MADTTKYNRGRFAPEALDVRKKAKHNRYESMGAMPTTLDGVSVVLSDSEKPHMYSAPEAEGPEFRRLRRFGLLLSRYGLVDKNKFARKRDLPLDIVTCAERVVATNAYREVYGGDPTIGTTNLAPLAAMLSQPKCPPSTIAHALSYMGTQAYQQLCDMVTNPLVKDDLEHVAGSYNSSFAYRAMSIKAYINKQGNSNTRYTNNQYESLCNMLMNGVNHMESQANQREAMEQQRQADKQRRLRGNDRLKRNTPDKLEGKRIPQQGNKPALREIVPTLNGWCQALLEKMPLTLPHTGRKGRKLIPVPQGKSIRFIAREDTDPEQRVFARKTRSKGGIVIVDCSGSMSFDTEDLDRIMAATAGATVLCYSSGNEPQGANIWLVAQNGRRTSRLPYFPGNNGVDGPALEYGLSLRRHNEPVVWISDTRVTGEHDAASEQLRDWCLAFCDRHDVYITPNSYEAATLLRRIQMGKRPRLKPLDRDNESRGYMNYVQ